MTELERVRTTVTLSGANWAWLYQRARRQRRALTQELDLLLDEIRLAEQNEADLEHKHGVIR